MFAFEQKLGGVGGSKVRNHYKSGNPSLPPYSSEWPPLANIHRFIKIHLSKDETSFKEKVVAFNNSTPDTSVCDCTLKTKQTSKEGSQRFTFKKKTKLHTVQFR